MKARVLFVALLTTFLVGCASTKYDFTQAETKNTIIAYEEFVRQHPDSEYANIAKQRISDLQNELKEQKEKAKKSRKEAIAKIGQYVPGNLTDDEFFSQGWNNVDPYLERIGVLEFHEEYDYDKNEKVLTIDMGFYIGFGFSEDSRLNIETRAVWDFLMKSRHDSGAVSARGGTRRRLNGKYVPPQKVCKLIFIDGQFDSLEWQFEDYFDNNSRNWPIKDTPEILLQVSQGKYIMAHRRERGTWFAYQRQPGLSKFDFEIECDVKHTDGVTNIGYGIAFGLKDPKSQYIFLISADGSYNYSKRLDNRVTNIIPWTKSGFINQGSSSNRLAIRRNSEQLEFLINNEVVNRAAFEILPGDRVGFMVEGKQTVEFDNFIVRQI